VQHLARAPARAAGELFVKGFWQFRRSSARDRIDIALSPGSN
jgi:hypothetical protein